MNLRIYEVVQKCPQSWVAMITDDEDGVHALVSRDTRERARRDAQQIIDALADLPDLSDHAGQPANTTEQMP